MKILQIIDSLNVGGAERVFVDLSNLLYENKVDVSVLIFKQEGVLVKELNENLPQIKFKRKNKYSLITAFQLAKLVKNFDILHVHSRHNYRYVKLVSLVFNVTTKIVLHDHYGKIKIDKSIPKFFNSYLKPKFYIGVDSELISFARNKLKVKNDFIFLLRNIVLKKDYKSTLKKDNAIVLVGNIKPVKNQLFAIRLLPYLKENLTIIGNIQDQEYFTILKNEIKNLSLEKRVFFIHDCKDVQEHLSNYKLALNVSKSESGPLVLAEYLAQSIPFIAYQTGEIARILKPELPESFIDSFEIKDWLNQIKKLPLNRRTDFTEIFNTYFSSITYIAKCKEIYQKIMIS